MSKEKTPNIKDEKRKESTYLTYKNGKIIEEKHPGENEERSEKRKNKLKEILLFIIVFILLFLSFRLAFSLLKPLQLQMKTVETEHEEESEKIDDFFSRLSLTFEKPDKKELKEKYPDINVKAETDLEFFDQHNGSIKSLYSETASVLSIYFKDKEGKHATRKSLTSIQERLKLVREVIEEDKMDKKLKEILLIRVSLLSDFLGKNMESLDKNTLKSEFNSISTKELEYRDKCLNIISE